MDMQVEEGSEEGRTVAGLAEGRLQESGLPLGWGAGRGARGTAGCPSGW